MSSSGCQRGWNSHAGALTEVKRHWKSGIIMIEVEILTASQAHARQWDAQLANCPLASYTQTSVHGSFGREINRAEESYITATGDGGQAWLMLNEISALGAATRRRGGLGRAAAALAGTFRSFNWYGGPVFSSAEPAAGLLGALLDTVDKLARRRGVFSVQRALPPVYLPESGREIYRQAFKTAGYDCSPVATVLLRLEGSSLDELRSRLHKDVRRTVRKAGEQGVTIEEVRAEETMADFERIRAETALRGGFRAPEPEHYVKLLRHYPAGYMRFFIARHQGRPVSTQILAVYNRNYVLCGVSTSDYAINNKIHANDLMQWHLIRTAHAEGASYLDWAGYSLNPSNAHQQGINRYKLKWGGEILEYDSYSKVYSPLKRRLITLARRTFAE